MDSAPGLPAYPKAVFHLALMFAPYGAASSHLGKASAEIGAEKEDVDA